MAKPFSELGQLSVEQKTMGQMSVEQKRCRRRFLGQLSMGKFVWGKRRSIPDYRDHPDGRASAYEDVVGLSLVYLDLLIYTNVDK